MKYCLWQIKLQQKEKRVLSLKFSSFSNINISTYETWLTISRYRLQVLNLNFYLVLCKHFLTVSIQMHMQHAIRMLVHKGRLFYNYSLYRFYDAYAIKSLQLQFISFSVVCFFVSTKLGWIFSWLNFFKRNLHRSAKRYE